jgi:hypothetical protein
MMTRSGVKFDLINPTAEMIVIDDVAHHLSMICRYNGATNKFYSVAEHSVYVFRQVKRQIRNLIGATAKFSHDDVVVMMVALLHDGPEYVIGDVCRPIKHQVGMSYFRGKDDQISRLFMERFELPFIMNDLIKDVDDRIIFDEWAALMRPTEDYICVTGKPLGIHIGGWMPELARSMFMDAYNELCQAMLDC